MCVFNIKGWSRTLAAVAILRCAYENEEFMKARIIPFILPNIFSLGYLVYSCFVNFAGRPSQTLWLSLVLMTKSINTLVTVITPRSKTHLLAKHMPNTPRSLRTIHATCKMTSSKEEVVSTNRGNLIKVICCSVAIQSCDLCCLSLFTWPEISKESHSHQQQQEDVLMHWIFISSWSFSRMLGHQLKLPFRPFGSPTC